MLILIVVGFIVMLSEVMRFARKRTEMTEEKRKTEYAIIVQNVLLRRLAEALCEALEKALEKNVSYDQHLEEMRKLAYELERRLKETSASDDPADYWKKENE
jgi:hypothetical protein